MPKRKRASGYYYKVNSAGKRYRVYRKGKGGAPYKKRSYNRKRRGRVDYFGDTIMGYGAYRKGRGGSKVLAGNPPTVQNSSGGFIIRHREYIGDMPSSVAFQNYIFTLNPGLNQTFPWLASLAENFEEWVPRGIIFEYKTTSSDSVVSTNANAGLGTVIMATEYNPYNGAFGNKQQMENYEFAKSCKPSVSMLHAVECSKYKNPMGSYFIRTGDVPSGQDKRLYDLGDFQIAAVGMQSNNTVIGELWCSYEIELRKPRIPAGIAGRDNGNTNVDHFQILAPPYGVASGVTPNTPFGIQALPIYPTTKSTLGGVLCGGNVPASAMGVSPDTPTGSNFAGGFTQLNNAPGLSGTTGSSTGALGISYSNTYYFPPGVSSGVFMCTYLGNYVTGGATWNPVHTYMNCEDVHLLDKDTLEHLANSAGAGTSLQTMDVLFIRILGPNASIKFTGSTGAYTGWDFSDLFITQLPSVIN